MEKRPKIRIIVQSSNSDAVCTPRDIMKYFARCIDHSDIVLVRPTSKHDRFVGNGFHSIDVMVNAPPPHGKDKKDDIRRTLTKFCGNRESPPPFRLSNNLYNVYARVLSSGSESESGSGSTNGQQYKPTNEILSLSWISKIDPMLLYIETGSLSPKTPMGKEISYIKIGKGEKIVWIQSGVHAREWIAPASLMGCVNRWIDECKYQKCAFNFADEFTFFIVPLVNPDGYAISKSEVDDDVYQNMKSPVCCSNDTNIIPTKMDDVEFTQSICKESCRLWRKNRNGVDLNRNWKYYKALTAEDTKQNHFNVAKQDYKGVKPFSEPETLAVDTKIKEVVGAYGKMHMLIDVHSYGQMILYPWGYSLGGKEAEQSPENAAVVEKHRTLAYRASKMIKDKLGVHYKPMRSLDLYEAIGTIDDYIIKEGLSEYAFTIELLDRGHYGFFIPPDFIDEGISHLSTLIESLLLDRQQQ